MQRLVAIVVVTGLNCSPWFAQATKDLAPGAPGVDAHWPSAAKNGFGTASGLRSKVWFTLADGVMTEVYYPTLDVPNVQKLQLVIVTADGKVETESDDTNHSVQVLDDARSLSFRQENRAKSGAYTITKNYVSDPETSSVFVNVNFHWNATGQCGCSIYVYYDPSLNNSGMHDSAWIDGDWLVAADTNRASALTEIRYGLADETNGYVSITDGLTKLQRSGR